MVSAEDLRKAKKAGFKKKAPKKPKKSSSISVWERYDARMKDYAKQVKDAVKDYNKKQSLIKKY